jgi:hypothetical protein
MQSPVVVDPFKNERKLRKYEDGDTLLIRRIRAKVRKHEVDETLLYRHVKAKYTIVSDTSKLNHQLVWPPSDTDPWISMMSPPLPNMRTFESMVMRIERELVIMLEAMVADMEQELAYIRQATIVDCVDTLQVVVDELEED